MRYIFLLLLALGFNSLYAQYPNSVNKMRLGTQTTGDGLIYRHSGVPNWTPTGLVNSWQSIDTTTGNLWAYRSGEWRLEVAGDLQQVYPKVINKSGVNIKRGEVVGVDTSQIIQGDLIRIMRAIGDGGLSSKLIMGIAATDINDNAEGYVVWFGYVREVKQANIAETGVTLNVGDILYLSATEPGRLTNVEPTPPALKSTIALLVRKPSVNNLTLLVRPSLNEDLSDLNDVDLNGVGNGQTIVWDSLNMKWIAGNVGTPIDTSLIATKSYVDSKVDSTRLTQDSILVYYIGGAEVGRDTLSLPPAGVTSITAGVGLTGGTITSTGTIAADTATVLATKDFVTTRGYLTAEVDGSVTNEGVLSTTSVSTNWGNINTNTSGGNSIAVTVEANTGQKVTFTTNTNGGGIVLGNDTTVLSTRLYADSKVDSTRLMQDSILVYYTGGIEVGRDTISGVGGGGGGLTGSGTTNTVAKFTSSTAIGNSLITDDGTNVAVGGTASLRLPSGTTAERPGTPLAGMARNNTSNNNLDFYTGTAWENFAKSAYATGLGTSTRIPFADENGRLRDTSTLTFDSQNRTLTTNFLTGSNYLFYPVTNGVRLQKLNDVPLRHLHTSGAVQINLPTNIFYPNSGTTTLTFDVNFHTLANLLSDYTIRVSLRASISADSTLGSGTTLRGFYIGATDLSTVNLRVGFDGVNFTLWLGEIANVFGTRSITISNITAYNGNVTYNLRESVFTLSSQTSAFSNVVATQLVDQIPNNLLQTNTNISQRAHILTRPNGKSISGTENASTGAFEFTIPKKAEYTQDINVKFDFEYREGATFISGQVTASLNLSSRVWSNGRVVFFEGSPVNNTRLTIRLGHDGTDYKIWFGELNQSNSGRTHVFISNFNIYHFQSTSVPAALRDLSLATWTTAIQSSAFGTVNVILTPPTRNNVPYLTTTGESVSNNFTYNPTTNRLAVGDTTSVRTLTVNGEARITDLTTDTPTRIVGADADGDLGAITVGSGLTLSGGTLTASGAGTTNLTFSGASSPVTLNSDTGTDVTFTAGTGVTFSQSSNNLTISATAPTRQIASFTSSGGQVVLSQFDNEIADNDLTGTHTGYATSDFVADSSYVRYTGTDTIYVRLTAQISFLSNAVSNLIIGIGVDPGFNTITETAVYFRTATSGQHSLPVLSHIYQCAPNTKFYLNVENTTNNTITLDTFYNIQVEKIN